MQTLTYPLTGEQTSDIAYLQDALQRAGYDISNQALERVWRDYSAEYSVNWLAPYQQQNLSSDVARIIEMCKNAS